MARALDPTKPFGRQVRQLVRSRLRDSLRVLDATRPRAGDDLEDAVHRVRRTTKEVRALVRLLDDARSGPTRRLDRLAQHAARHLGPVRDASVRTRLEATHGIGQASRPGTVPIAATADAIDAVDRASRSLERALAVANHLPTRAGPSELREGLRRTYASARRAHRDARRDPSPTNVHRWRIRNKRLWYQVRALSTGAPSVLLPLAELLDEVGELLGDVHDIDVYLAVDADDLTDDERRSLEQDRDDRCARAIRLGSTVHVETADAFATRVAGAWRLGARHGPEPAR